MINIEKLKKCHISDGHAPSLLPEGEWKLVWNDEFDGNELDRAKWDYRLNYWGQRSPTFTDKGVEVSGGSVKLYLQKDEDGVFRSPHLQTGEMAFDPPIGYGRWPVGKRAQPKFMHSFGYYECRCRLPKNDGWHAAFWLQSPSIGTHPDAETCGVECDIMENYLQRKPEGTKDVGSIICGNGYGGYGAESKWPGHFRHKLTETEDGWHYFSCDWTEKGYWFYMDGDFVGFQGTLTPEMEGDPRFLYSPVSRCRQFVLISTECHGYHNPLRGIDPRGGLENATFGAGFGSKSDSGITEEHAAAVKNPLNRGYVMNARPVPALLDAVLPDCFEVDFVRVFDRI